MKNDFISLTLTFMAFLTNSTGTAIAQNQDAGNDPQRVEWFMDQALGMFIHWNIDSQLGSVISHSMVGASKEYLERYVNELPESFCPENFDPDKWARTAKLAGMKYVVFTTKHHSGFCMFDTKTTNFNVMNTPHQGDITMQIVEAFRKHGLAIGFYFSPDDFWVLYKQGHQVSRLRDEAQPWNNPELMQHNLQQLRELLTDYGPVDFMFFDGVREGRHRIQEMKSLCRELQPKMLITRGLMETPEQNMPDEPMPGPWEANFTLGTQWNFKPTNEEYKSGTMLIEMLIEIRAKGGNFLLNVGPTPEGEIPFEQSRRIQELALWMFINDEAIHNIRPWHIIRENNIWFTKAKDSNTVYAIVTGLWKPAGQKRVSNDLSDQTGNTGVGANPMVGNNYSPDRLIGTWKRGERKEFTLKSVRATDKTEIEILGQSGEVLEYRPDVNPETTWKLDENGLHISAMRAQRIYNNNTWPNPIVIKITNAAAAE